MGHSAVPSVSRPVDCSVWRGCNLTPVEVRRRQRAPFRRVVLSTPVTDWRVIRDTVICTPAAQFLWTCSLSLISCLNFNFSLSPATTLNRRSTVRASAADSGQAEPLPATFSQQYLISSRWLFCLRGKSRSLWTIYEQAIHDDNDSNNYGWKSTECLPLPRRITQLYFSAKCDNKKKQNKNRT